MSRGREVLLALAAIAGIGALAPTLSPSPEPQPRSLPERQPAYPVRREAPRPVRRRNPLHPATDGTSETDIRAIEAAEAKRRRKAAKLEVLADKGAIGRAR